MPRALARWLIGATLLLGPFAASAWAQPWWSDCFSCRRQITVTTTTAPVGSGYSVNLTFDHAALTPTKSQADGDDVRLLHWNGATWTELDRVLDPLSTWDSATTKIWFALVDPIGVSSSDSNYFLYYGNLLALDPPDDWANVFRMGDDFDDGTVTGGLTASTSGAATITETGGEHVLNGGAVVGDTGISVATNPLAANRQFAIRHKVKNVSGGGSSDPEAKSIGIVDSAARPTVVTAAVENPRRQIIVFHRINDGAVRIIYFDSVDAQIHWDGAAWSGGFPDWTILPLDTYYIYDLISDGTSWHVVVSDAAGTVLTTTTPVTWASMRDLGNDSWFYFGEVYTDFYFVDQKSDWVYLRDYVGPEPTTSLAAETAGPGAPTVNYRSIGTNAATLASGPDATIAAAGTTVTFASGTLPMNVGLGDEIVIGGETFHVLSRDSAAQVTVQIGGGAHTGAAYTITRAFSGANAIQSWETARQGDLVASNRREVGVAYNDATFTNGFTIASSITDSCHFMWLTVAPGQRHNGTAGTGVVLDGGNTMLETAQLLDDYTRYDWFEVKSYKGAGGNVVDIRAQNVELNRLIIHDFFDPGFPNIDGISIRSTAGVWSVTVRNTLVYDGGGSCIQGDTADDTIVVENATLHDCGRGIYQDSGTTVHVRNTISTGNSTADFALGTGTQSNNISQDGTQAGPGSFQVADPTLLFVNITPGDETNWDLHLIAGAAAVDAGADLGGEFCCDIDTELRPWGALWDIGADERPATPLCPVTPQSWFDRGWSFRKAIVIDASKVTGALTDYPVLINLASDTELAATAQVTGNDILFTASDGVTKLSHEIEMFVKATGELVAWVKAPYLSSGANTTLYMYYGNGGVASQQDAQNAWDASHAAVWHLKEDPTDPAPQFLDSTANPNDGTASSLAGANQVPGQVDGSLVFDDTNERHVNVPDDPTLRFPADITASAWVRTSDTDADVGVIVNKWGPAGSRNYWLGKDNATDLTFFVNDTESVVASLALISDGSWHHVVGVADATSGLLRIYTDGQQRNTAAYGGTSEMGANALHIGNSSDVITMQEWSGGLDEVRISATTRSPEWIETQYNNQFAPASFHTVCSATTSVELSSFEAVALDGAVDLVWETATELDNLGFQLYRSTSELGDYERITSTAIPGLGSSPVGARYSYRDEDVQNGITYYYELEDIETTGARELHGPVSATPETGLASEFEPSSEPKDTAARLTYGEPQASAFRIVRRKNGVVLTRDTTGFVAVPQEDGSVRLEVPGLEEMVGSSLPVERAWVEAVAGKKVKIVSVRARQVERFEGLRPSAALVSELEASANGTVRARLLRRGRRLARREGAKLLEVAYQGETKKALFELSPFTWDGSGLVLAKSLEVHVAFRGREVSARRTRRAKGRVAVRLATVERGLYTVSLEELVGRRRARRTKALRLSRQGEAVAYHLEDGVLYFWSEGAAVNPYGTEAVYELELGVAGETMEVVGDASGASDAFYWHELEREENRYYQAALVNAPDVWLWELLFAPDRKSFAFDVTELADVFESSRLELWLQGASDFPRVEDHHVRVFVNGNFIAESRWDGKNAHKIEVELASGILQEGENVLELESPGDTGAEYSMVLLDRFRVRYPRQVTVVENARYVLDVTEASPRWVASRAGFDGERSYVAIDEVMRPEPRNVTSTNLRKRRRAEYLVIGPQAFIDAARPLLRHRNGQGLRVATASTEAIASEFGHGELTPEAIRELIAYAYHEWRPPKLRYVLLLGDATYDFKDYMGTGVSNQLPPYMVRTSYLWTASDPAYASVNGDDALPDLAIGRLPAATVSELRVMIEKILDWETGLASGGAPPLTEGPVVLVADNADRAGNFEADADEIASSILASTVTETIYASRLGTDATRDAIREAFDQGATSMSYVGHGGIHLWAAENFFNISTVDSLTTQPRQPLVLTLNCLNGFFHFPFFNSLGEELVKAENKGAIAAISPSGLSLNGPAHRFHKALLTELFHGDHDRLGDAVLAAQQNYAESGAWPELLRIYHLLGDPALILR